MVYSVRNIVESTPTRCGCGCRSWLSHWMRATGRTSHVCSVVGCVGTAVYGVRVRETAQTAGMSLRVEYVVPMCAAHSAVLFCDLLVDTELVLARELPSCGT